MPSWPMIEYQAETQRLMVRVAVALIDKTRSESRNEDSFFDIWFGSSIPALQTSPGQTSPGHVGLGQTGRGQI
jgi:hypothetical protein